MFKRIYDPRLYVAVLLLAFTGCALLGGAPPAPKTISQSLVYAEATATAANTLAASAVTSHAISVAQAKEVGAASDLVVACVKKARALVSLGDAVGAQAQLTALAADLQLLNDFLAAHSKAVGGSP